MQVLNFKVEPSHTSKCNTKAGTLTQDQSVGFVIDDLLIPDSSGAGIQLVNREVQREFNAGAEGHRTFGQLALGVRR
jgi:hypothetical protein